MHMQSYYLVYVSAAFKTLTDKLGLFKDVIEYQNVEDLMCKTSGLRNAILNHGSYTLLPNVL